MTPPIFTVGLPTSVNLINQDNPSPAWPKVYLFGDFSPGKCTILVTTIAFGEALLHHACVT